MGGEKIIPTILVLLSSSIFTSLTLASDPSSSYNPPDEYLIACGSPRPIELHDGRSFKSDHDSSSLLSTDEDILASSTSVPVIGSSVLSSSLPLYQNTRIFLDESTYIFYISQPGWHWIRLYFYPVHHATYKLSNAVFSVIADEFVLLHDFFMTDNASVVFKEYLINVTQTHVSLKFKPQKRLVAFINAIELVSAPDFILSDSAATVAPIGTLNGISNHALEVSYRLNVGGPIITPKNDVLSRVWQSDAGYMQFPQGARNVSVPPESINYSESGGVTPYIAPNTVYSTAHEMVDANVSDSNFNLTWQLKVDSSFSYLIRMHFCDIVSESLNELYFNVYINGMMATPGLDLSSLTFDLGVPYYKDFVANASTIVNGTLTVQVGPASNMDSVIPNAILNGLEVVKMSNSAGSLDGLFSVVEKEGEEGRVMKTKVFEGVGVSLIAASVVFLFVLVVRSRRPPKNWENSHTSSSWLLPLNTSQVSSFLSTKSITRIFFGGCVSKNGNSTIYSNPCLGRSFTLNELKIATNGFDEKAVVGVGGFGQVYLGNLEDGTMLAIKRGSQGAVQGINEFWTEIELLSKLRHRHLVSLIGYCDKQSEMILVYEYMANGPFRDHLYGSNLPPLSWKQRLEICIGAARGLHYLHTGAAQSVIHRDVKTTNILLDENFVAKVSDFGLSKAFAPTVDQTHVSTAVKGSFGYLDPEYFRRQQLSEKSDVYSFGVVLLEVLCARPALRPALPREQVNLAEWAMNRHRKGMIQEIIDPAIVKTICPGSLEKYIEAAEKCLADHGVDRPGMGKVLWYLEYALQLQDASCQGGRDTHQNQKDDPSEPGKLREKENGGEIALVNDHSEVNASAPLFSDLEAR